MYSTVGATNLVYVLSDSQGILAVRQVVYLKKETRWAPFEDGASVTEVERVYTELRDAWHKGAFRHQPLGVQRRLALDIFARQDPAIMRPACNRLIYVSQDGVPKVETFMNDRAGRAFLDELDPAEAGHLGRMDLEAILKQVQIQVVIRCDLDDRCVYISESDPYDTENRLTLSFYEQEAVVKKLFFSAVSIGYGLGTVPQRYQRLYMEPWSYLGKLLAQPGDPLLLLEEAMKSDCLAFTCWLETDRQAELHALNDPFLLEDAYGHTRALYLSDPDSPCLRTRLLFTRNADGSYRLHVPFADQMPEFAVLLPDEPLHVSVAGIVEGVAKNLRLCQLGRILELTLYVDQYLSTLEYKQKESAQNAVSLVAQYIKALAIQNFPCGELYVAPGAEHILPMTCAQLRGWLEDSLTPYCLPVVPEVALDNDIVLVKDEERWWTRTIRNLWAGILDSFQTCMGQYGTFFQDVARRFPFYVCVGNQVYLLRTGDVNLLTGEVVQWHGSKAVKVKREEGFLLIPWTDIEDELVHLFVRMGPAQQFLETVCGRSRLDLDVLGKRRCFMRRDVLFACDSLRDAAMASVCHDLNLITIPIGWRYVLAMYRDGSIGIAVGPSVSEREQQDAELCMERLYAQAASEPPENALYILQKAGSH